MATMTTMTTTLGLLKLWPPTTSAAAMCAQSGPGQLLVGHQQ